MRLAAPLLGVLTSLALSGCFAPNQVSPLGETDAADGTTTAGGQTMTNSGPDSDPTTAGSSPSSSTSGAAGTDTTAASSTGQGNETDGGGPDDTTGSDDTTGVGPGQTGSSTGTEGSTGDGSGQTDSTTGTDSGTDSGTESSSSDGAVPINGCEGPGAAVDMTGMPMVELDWQLGHQQCVLVDTGTTVRWNGNFGAHPIEGGETGTQDPASPITAAEGDTGAMVDVTFDTAGEYPYYCAIHLQNMQGVIYVE